MQFIYLYRYVSTHARHKGNTIVEKGGVFIVFLKWQLLDFFLFPSKPNASHPFSIGNQNLAADHKKE